MDEKTLTALKKSISKWERNAVAETPKDYTLGIKTCALCTLFFRRGFCTGCPVQAKTGMSCCIGSPYNGADNARRKWRDDPSNTALRDAAHAAARAEADFLRSLLPKAEATQ